ncbi:hypothetical protein M758_1G183600 [Ceratodon purpureus]|uniref:Peptidase A1 domain-containing protein n=1 Tax=Ceratodon purpureus TaxID=3225 RepID=A0A8T0J9G4_CERPU|nr:hypothetical protein KC19_1G187100 [Ceratodon purpureus]KAG0630512.1 hypothetical protein M758_1G183600 [Ceratodon purpureus]
MHRRGDAQRIGRNSSLGYHPPRSELQSITQGAHLKHIITVRKLFVQQIRVHKTMAIRTVALLQLLMVIAIANHEAHAIRHHGDGKPALAHVEGFLTDMSSGAHGDGSNDHRVLSVELLHRDHPSSPLYVGASKEDRIARSVRRSREYVGDGGGGARRRRMRRVLDMGDGEYVMSLKIGTPPQRFAAVMSTVESVVWVQCLPCGEVDGQGCYEQRGAMFNPRLSTTFRNISCTSRACPSFGDEVEGPDWNSCGESNQCLYDFDWAGDEAPYGEDTASLGDFVTDSLTLDTNISLGSFAFGCSHEYYDLSGMNGSGNANAGGFVGLGPGALSLFSQLNQTVSHDRFSYCLLAAEISSNQSTSVLFGNVRTLPGVVYTPIVDVETGYDVGLRGITVNGRRLSIPRGAFSGGVAFDARIALSVFGDEAYNFIRNAVRKEMKRYEETSHEGMDLCYNVAEVSNPVLPSAVLHFAKSADYSCSAENLFMYMDEGETILCLAMLSRDTYTDSRFSSYNIIGNVMQQNHQLIFDKGRSRLGFTSTNCASI